MAGQRSASVLAEIREKLALLPPTDVRLVRTEGRSAYALLSEPVSEDERRRAQQEHDELSRLPEVQGRLAEIMTEYSRRWYDEVVLALRNRRPRTLVKTAAGRARVLALIQQFESGPQAPAAIGGMDFGLIRRELGLPPR